jgi:dTDP-4-dehydrorhamnose 3,5-epimerase
MKVTALKIPDVLIFEPQVISDERGFFFESFNQKKFEEIILGTLRSRGWFDA